MLTEEIKAKIMPQVEKISEQIGDEPNIILNDFEKSYNRYINGGMESEKAIKTAVNSVRVSYAKLKKLNARLYEGFFVAATEKKDRNIFIRKEAELLLEKFKNENGDLWKPKAIASKMIDNKGNFLVTHEIFETKYNANPKMKWIIGRKIEVDEQKAAWAFVREFESEDSLRLVNVYIQEPDEFTPIFGKMYKFRGTIKTSMNKENMTFYQTLSKLHPLDEIIPFEDIEEYIATFEENIKTFEEVYDDESSIGILPPAPAPKFCITEVVIGSINGGNSDKKNIDVTEQMSDFDVEPITLSIPNEYSDGIYDGAIGILFFRPFYRNKRDSDGNSIGKIRSGEALGFISDSKFAPVFDNEISDEPYQEEYN